MAFDQELAGLMRRRGLRKTDIARAAGVSISGVTHWLEHGGVPMPETCERMAHGLGLSKRTIFRMAGYWTPRTNEVSEEPDEQFSEEALEVARRFECLPADGREIVGAVIAQAEKIVNLARENSAHAPIIVVPVVPTNSRQNGHDNKASRRANVSNRPHGGEFSLSKQPAFAMASR